MRRLKITLSSGSIPTSVLAIQTVINRKGVLNSHFKSNPDLCYFQNHVITNRVIKRFRCTIKFGQTALGLQGV